MSNINLSNNIPKGTLIAEIIKSCEERFKKFDYLDFKAEALFATQLCLKNSTLASTALSNPDSMKMAVLNVAAIGLSLNPAAGLAHLVPRNNEVVLDISYRGLLSLAVECGSIQWSRPVLVYSSDDFVYKGPTIVPDHISDPFMSPEERGDVKGGYCITKLGNGDLMVGTMNYATMEKIRLSSPLGRNNVGPWVDWKDQMQLKVMVKRESKFWNIGSGRFIQAMDILNNQNEEGLAERIDSGLLEGHENVHQLPEPIDRNQVTVEVSDFVDALLERASKNGSYEACLELARTRINDKAELSYAVSMLKSAQSKQLNRANDVVQMIEKET